MLWHGGAARGQCTLLLRGGVYGIAWGGGGTRARLRTHAGHHHVSWGVGGGMHIVARVGVGRVAPSRSAAHACARCGAAFRATAPRAVQTTYTDLSRALGATRTRLGARARAPRRTWRHAGTRASVTPACVSHAPMATPRTRHPRHRPCGMINTAGRGVCCARLLHGDRGAVGWGPCAPRHCTW